MLGVPPLRNSDAHLPEYSLLAGALPPRDNHHNMNALRSTKRSSASEVAIANVAAYIIVVAVVAVVVVTVVANVVGSK